MMIDQSIKKVRGYPKAVMRSTQETLKSNEKYIAEWNVENLKKGEHPDGSLFPGYAKSTAEDYPRTTAVSAGEPIKLLDTGKFHKSIKAKAKDNEVSIFSNSSRSTEDGSQMLKTLLEETYDNFYGINADQMEALTKRVKNHLFEDLRRYFK